MYTCVGLAIVTYTTIVLDPIHVWCIVIWAMATDIDMLISLYYSLLYLGNTSIYVYNSYKFYTEYLGVTHNTLSHKFCTPTTLKFKLQTYFPQ